MGIRNSSQLFDILEPVVAEAKGREWSETLYSF